MISQDEPTIKTAISKMEHDAASEKAPAHESAELAIYSVSALNGKGLSMILIRLILSEQFQRLLCIALVTVDMRISSLAIL